ncbi:MAG: hypothetical protein PWR09_956 [Archaeoglobi archaeon]|nr:hypothetical protein [Archaeoglobi archaeon]
MLMKRKIGEEVSDCLLCMLCNEGCPTGVDLRRIVPLSRYVYEPRGSHGSMFLTLLSFSPLLSWKYSGVRTDESSEIAFFPGCAPVFDTAFKIVETEPYGNYSAMGRDRKYSNMGYAALKVLNHLGITPRLITACCGHDLYYSGMLDEFEKLKEALKELFSGVKLVISNCAECVHSLRDLHGIPAVHISQFIAENLERIHAERLPFRFIYHDSCRLGRYSGIYEEPRKIIEAFGELVEFRENRENSRCCGVSSWMNCNSVAKREREKKIEEFENSDADFLVVSCPKCAIHLDCVYYEEGGRRRRDRPNIIDISELTAMAMGIYSLEEIPEKKFEKSERSHHFFIPPPGEKNPVKYVDEELRNSLFSCTTCYYCTSVCQMGHRTPELIERFRRFFVSQNLNPERHRAIYRNTLETGNPYGEREEIFEEREDAEMIYFPGCTTKFRVKGIYESTKKILEALGVSYSVPKDLVCCGSPLLRSGYEIDEIRRKNLEILRKPVITSCAGCHATFQSDYGIDAVHIVEVLSQRVDELPLKSLEMRVIYHDPCHLGREFGIYEEPRRIIEAIPGVQLVEFEENRENSRCCGGGGGLRAWNPSKSQELARKRVEEAERKEVDAIVSSCPFCKLNLQSVTDTEVLDITELLARALKQNFS